MKYLNKEEFENLVKDKTSFILVASAQWCAPCKAYNKVLEDSATESTFPIFKFDIDDEPDIAVQFKIRSVPSTLVFKEGELQKTVTGSMNKKAFLELV